MNLLAAICLLLSVAGVLHGHGESAAAAEAALPEWARSLPGRPVTVVSGDDPAAWGVQRPEGVTTSVVARDGGGTALRIDVDRPYQPVYAVQVFSPATSAAVRSGDVVLVSFLARAPTAVAGASAVAAYRLQQTAPPWDAPASGAITLSTSWQRVFAAGTARQDHPAGTLSVAFHLGQQRQSIELADITVLNFGPGVDVADLPANRLSWPGMEADAPWRAEARRRIERYRMAPLTVRVIDGEGRPVEGATVHVRQMSRAFQIGSFISTAYFHEPQASSPDSVRAREIFLRLFNRATTPIYWADWGWPSQREAYLAAARWLHARGIPTRGHVMIYPAFRFMPAEAVALRDDPPRLRQRLLEQIREIGQATREFGFIEYDVTNELRDCTDLHTLLGPEVVAEWFAEARRVVPGSKLALNENTILTDGGATEANQDLYLHWYRFLKDRGVAPDVLGFQGHFGEALTAPERVWEILDRFARETDAELQITEFDVHTLNEDAQAAYLRDFLTACFAHPRVTAFTMWGFWEGDHWLPKAALFRTDFSPKPAALTFEQLLAAWSTDARLTTGTDGMASVRAFLGELAVEVRAGGPAHTVTVHLTQADTPLPIDVRLTGAARP
ncbi:MAG: endo-1,4-beta-xylanase [Tepidisphaerales bacterium]